jgi:hypothetical protein
MAKSTTKAEYRRVTGMSRVLIHNEQNACTKSVYYVNQSNKLRCSIK